MMRDSYDAGLKSKVLEEFNRTEKKFRNDLTIQGLFEEQAALKGNHTAVISDHDNFNGNNFLSYAELDYLSNNVAAYLKKQGAVSGSVIGICTQRSFGMIIGIMGILKSGCAYLPISPDNPPDRILYMLKDSGAEILLLQKEITGLNFNGKTISLSNNDIYTGNGEKQYVMCSPTDLAYVIYTSGSTGKPKGVMIEHRSVVNRLTWMQNTYSIDERDIILHKTPFYFDVSVWELFWWAFTGAKMFLLKPGEERIPMAIASAVKAHNVTVIHFVPSMLNVFLEYFDGKDKSQVQRLASLRLMFCSGEALTVSHVNKFNNIIRSVNRTRLINLYGPTEATVDVSYFECTDAESPDIIPIGKPIDNTKFFIINEDRLASIGETGELCISGAGLARGYINNPKLTSEKFIENPFSPGTKIYKTGDLARWLPDGNVEFLGRRDHQVKIRGLRIELGEIESTIRDYTGIKDSIVLIKQYSENIIIIAAYLVWRTKPDLENLKQYLKKYLPDYMIPNSFIDIDEIPLTPNGKADRRALPEPI